MVDLAYLTPEQKSMVIRGDAKYQFVYVQHQPIYANRINQELHNKICEMYNSTIMHARILEMHTPLMKFIQEKNLDNVSLKDIIPILQNLITYDYNAFKDLMVILAAMLENKDAEMMSNYIDSIVECSDQIAALTSVHEDSVDIESENTTDSTETFDISTRDQFPKNIEEEECGNGPCDPQMSPDE